MKVVHAEASVDLHDASILMYYKTTVENNVCVTSS